MAEAFESRYVLGEEIGRGGGAIVYRAQDTLLDRQVAIKVLHDSNLEAEGRARLLEEAKSVAQLNHPNIVTVFDAGEREGKPYIVMELVKGPSLHKARPREIDQIVDISRQICAALAHAHQHGIVHRDLKPENVLLGDDGKAKLVDFGLARSIADRVTTEGAITGTVFYLAPEQAMGQQIDGRADLYALGVILYELVAGRLPFEAEAPLAVISQHLHAPVVPPSTYNDAVPKALERLILHLLEKKPEARPASAEECNQALAEWDKELPESEIELELSLLDRIARGRLVGRERELAEFRAYWKRSLAGEGRVILISGEPGIGKTRLTREFLDRTRVSRFPALQGECYAEGGASYAPIVQILRQALEEGLIDSATIPQHVAADLISLAPELAFRFPETPPNPTLQPEAEKQRIFESFVSFCQLLWEDSSLLLSVDDVHWADSGTLELLRHLARRTRTQPLLIVLTYREVELDESLPLQEFLYSLNRERLTVRVKLGRLSRDKTREMLTAMFDETITDEFLDGIFYETEGNPFFIEEVCKALVEQGSLSFKDGRWDKPSMQNLQIPQSVRVAIQSRLGKLPEQAQRVLEIGAVIGNEFEYDLLLEASEVEEGVLIDALEMARRGQLIREIRSNGAVNFAFMHALIPTTLRNSVGGLRRRRYHSRVAQVLEVKRPHDFERLAYHHEYAGHPNRSRTYYFQAGERALRAHAFQDALRSFQRALDRWPEKDAPGRATLLHKYADCLGMLGDFAGQWQALEQAADLFEHADDRISQGNILRLMARVAWLMGDRAKSLDCAYRSLSILEKEKETEGLADIYESIGRLHMLASDYDQAVEWCERAIELADSQGVLDVRAEALNTIGTAQVQMGREEEGLGNLRKALQTALDNGFVGQALRSYHNLSEVLIALGKNAEAREVLEGYRSLSAQLHDPFSEPVALMRATHLDWLTGQWRQALSREVMLTELPEGVWMVWGFGVRAAIHNDLERFDQAAALLDLVVDLALKSNEVQTTVPFLAELARSQAGLSREDQAVSTISQYLNLIDETPYFENGSLWPVIFACRWFASHPQVTEVDSAEHCLERLALAEAQLNNPRARATHAEARGIVAKMEGRLGDAILHLEEALQGWRSLDYPYDQLRAMHDLQRAQIDMEDEVGARDLRNRALEIIETLMDQLDDHETRQAWLSTSLVRSFTEDTKLY
jgi:tetratricopeptide (TPR) repeat protein/tRNA A-37 threonylcarbamoyl transferase component Bud32